MRGEVGVYGRTAISVDPSSFGTGPRTSKHDATGMPEFLPSGSSKRNRCVLPVSFSRCCGERGAGDACRLQGWGP